MLENRDLISQPASPTWHFGLAIAGDGGTRVAWSQSRRLLLLLPLLLLRRLGGRRRVW